MILRCSPRLPALLPTSPVALLLLAIVGLAGCRGTQSGELKSLLVFAASDLQPALPEIARAFREETGIEVVLVFGSTGNLATQIEHGAPADLYLAANESFLERLSDAGRIEPASRTVYAIGRLALVAAPGVRMPGSVRELTAADYSAIAIANPAHAPYGIAAREALIAAGVWDAVVPRLVHAENVVQAHQLVRTASADAGMVALSLVISGDPDRLVRVDEHLHAPLRQAGGVVVGAANAPAAYRFLRFMTDPEGQRILARFGFGAPDSP